MKKVAYILIPALTGLFFTACQNEPKGPNQAEIDAQVAAKVESRIQELKTECDSRIMETAKMNADSIMAAAKGGAKDKPKATPPASTPKTTTKTIKTPPPPPVKETKKTVEGGGLRSQSDQSKLKDKNSVQGGGLRSQSDEKKVENKNSVQGGGLRGQSDQAKQNK